MSPEEMDARFARLLGLHCEMLNLADAMSKHIDMVEDRLDRVIALVTEDADPWNPSDKAKVDLSSGAARREWIRRKRKRGA